MSTENPTKISFSKEAAPQIGPGWTIHTVPRKNQGPGKKNYDKYFHSPDGQRFRSIPDVQRYLKTETGGGSGPKPSPWNPASKKITLSSREKSTRNATKSSSKAGDGAEDRSAPFALHKPRNFGVDIEVGEVGYTFFKYFGGHGWFDGEVVEIRSEGVPKDRRVRYADGDMEDLTLNEIRNLPRLIESQGEVITSRIVNHQLDSSEIEGRTMLSWRHLETDPLDLGYKRAPNNSASGNVTARQPKRLSQNTAKDQTPLSRQEVIAKNSKKDASDNAKVVSTHQLITSTAPKRSPEINTLPEAKKPKTATSPEIVTPVIPRETSEIVPTTPSVTRPEAVQVAITGIPVSIDVQRETVDLGTATASSPGDEQSIVESPTTQQTAHETETLQTPLAENNVNNFTTSTVDAGSNEYPRIPNVPALASLLARQATKYPRIRRNLNLSLAMIRVDSRKPQFIPPPGTIIPKGFQWIQFRPLLDILREHMGSYYELSTTNQSSDLQGLNYMLVELVKAETIQRGWKFDGNTLDDKKVRDRIKSFYKTHFQNSNKRLTSILKNPETPQNVEELAQHLHLIEDPDILENEPVVMYDTNNQSVNDDDSSGEDVETGDAIHAEVEENHVDVSEVEKPKTA